MGTGARENAGAAADPLGELRASGHAARMATERSAELTPAEVKR